MESISGLVDSQEYYKHALAVSISFGLIYIFWKVRDDPIASR